LVDDKGNYDPAAYAVKSVPLKLFGYTLNWQIVPKIDIEPGDAGAAPSCAGIGVKYAEDFRTAWQLCQKNIGAIETDLNNAALAVRKNRQAIAAATGS
jgi:hypothetical protein